MHTIKYSFIKSLLGTNTYEDYKSYAKKYIPIATIVLVMVLVLTHFLHWGFLSSVLNLITGTSLIFIAYVFGLVLLLDYGVEVNIEENWNGRYGMPKAKPDCYINTKVWGIVLIILAIAAIYFSNEYRKHYAFECETFLVDENKGLYHLDGYINDCEELEEDSYLVPLKGYEIEKQGYSFCPSCKQWVEDAEEYQSERFSRR